MYIYDTTLGWTEIDSQKDEEILLRELITKHGEFIAEYERRKRSSAADFAAASRGLLKTLTGVEIQENLKSLGSPLNTFRRVLEDTIADKSVRQTLQIAIENCFLYDLTSNMPLLEIINSLDDYITEVSSKDEDDKEYFYDSDSSETDEVYDSSDIEILINIKDEKQKLIDKLETITSYNKKEFADIQSNKNQYSHPITPTSLAYSFHLIDSIAALDDKSELMILCADHVDDDLLQVMSYRQKKTNGHLLVVRSSDLDTAIKESHKLGKPVVFPHISKLSILHHSGQTLINQDFEKKHLEELTTIGSTLPNCINVVERGCGMDKLSGIKSVMTDLKDSAMHNETYKEKLKSGEITFPKGDERRQIRDYTLELEGDKAEITKGDLLKKIEKKLIQAGLGINKGSINLKFYVQGYKGSDKGALPSIGVDKDDSYKSIPKSIRTKVDTLETLETSDIPSSNALKPR